MASVLDQLRMSEPVSRAGASRAEPNLPIPAIADVRDAVIDFFKEMPEVREVKVAKVALMDSKEGTWEAEAEVYVPNETIKALGLPVQKEVLDCRSYLLRVDGGLNVVAYGLTDSVEERKA